MSQALSLIHYIYFQMSQVRTWGRQTCFFPRASSNLVTPLNLTRLLPLQLRFERIQYISLS